MSRLAFPSGAPAAGLALALALTLGWAWRLVYQFVLASSGFWYFVADDPCRWLLAWSWSREPFLITWDGIWQGATFYLHGLAMRIGGDPLVASKFVSAFYPLICLAGILVFTLGLYRDGRLAAAAVAFAAPWSLHVLLGTGTMTEMPVVGLLLGGSGLLLAGLRAEGPRRRRLLVFAALALAAATAFHFVAWMIVAAILGAALLYALWRGKPEGFGPARWLAFSLLATSYCTIWIVGCWVKFGRPFDFLRRYAELNTVFAGPLGVSGRLLPYPSALLDTVRGFLPLVAFGILFGLFHNGGERGRVRAVLVAAVVALAILMLSAIGGNVGALPYRATLPLAAALVPIALAPLRSLLPRRNRGPADSPGLTLHKSAVPAAVVAAIFASWFLANHLEVLELRRSANVLDTDAIALGVWLRQEIEHPRTLGAVSPAAPIRLWLREPSLYSMLGIVHAAGHPERVQEWKGPDPGASSLRPGQYLVSDRGVEEPGLVARARHGRYTVYRVGEGKR
jgi:hypothetical protein